MSSGARAARAAPRAREQVLKVKIISMGDARVGKSCLIKRYCEDKFIQKYIGTIGVDYGVKALRLGGMEVRINMWDLAGGFDYAEIRNEFYKNTQGAVLVYDVADRGSFDSLDRWLDESAQNGGKDTIYVVAATKCDILARSVSEEEGRKWAASKGFPFFEVSSQSGARVAALFTTLLARMLATVPGMPREAVAEMVKLANGERLRAEMPAM
mmetsp:Transcript_11486/g.29016  ORF Transcript_11486/g.29016 Transcript_11486/m.29016 type:complete len:212 (+) Transcript_11486:374-1009(+)|eukprot:jgi/Tetstr1/427140/TSEL_017329.t1